MKNLLRVALSVLIMMFSVTACTNENEEQREELDLRERGALRPDGMEPTMTDD